MAGARPRELLGLPPRRLQPGDPADLVLFDWDEGGALRTVRTSGKQFAQFLPLVELFRGSGLLHSPIEFSIAFAATAAPIQ